MQSCVAAAAQTPGYVMVTVNTSCSYGVTADNSCTGNDFSIRVIDGNGNEARDCHKDPAAAGAPTPFVFSCRIEKPANQSERSSYWTLYYTPARNTPASLDQDIQIVAVEYR